MKSKTKKIDLSGLLIQPFTSHRWHDFESLFGSRGACGGCWCMWWRLKRSEYEDQKGDGNKAKMQAIVDSGEIPGLIAYIDGLPVGWCSVAPREKYSALERSRILKKVDEQAVWSIVCFFIPKAYRNKGLSVALIRGAIEYVKSHGGHIVEGYPVEPKNDLMPAVFAFTGLASAFKRAGFIECARRSETRPVMRYFIH